MPDYSEPPRTQPPSNRESGRSLLQALEELQTRAGDNGLSLRALCDSLGAKAIGGPLLVCALPCCLPFLYGVPQIMALPMLVLAGQIALGHQHLWLPERLGQRRIGAEAISRLVEQGRKPLQWLEIVSHPRLSALTGAAGRQIIGVFLFLFCLCVLVPLPMTNTVPGFAVAVTAFGLIERDGLFASLGVLLGCLWMAFLASLTFLAFGTGSEWLSKLIGS